MSFQIETLPLGALQTNCYLLWDTQSKETIVIDPAADGTFISEQILALQLKPQCIVLTHAHFDHIIGLLEVKLNFDIPILMHQADQFLLESLPQRAQYWLQTQVPPAPNADSFLKEGDTISIVNQQLQVLETPGHTPGGLCFYNDQIIVTGDTLFKSAIGRYDLSYSNFSHLKKSLKKIFQLPLHLKVYPGHGEPTTLAAEKRE